ncbi:hypothetical protein EON82_10495 [bacterium]|nr:MAG: hypothetical protein EON82_10495 [bacterium]
MHRRVLPYAFLAFAATAAAGGVALNRLLDRPGESALAFVPANALGAISLDLVPAPDQVLAFKSIDEMISSAAAKEPQAKTAKNALIGTLLHEFANKPELEPISKQVDRSIALAFLPEQGKPEGEGEGVVLLPVKDPQAIASFLASKGKPETAGGIPMVAIKSKDGSTVHFSLQGSVLVASGEAWPVADVVRAATGKSSALVADPAFAAARARAIPSANLLVFVSPKMAKGEEWLTGSMTIRDTGIEVGVSGQTNDPDVIKAGSLVPLGPDVMAKLPRGAYGFLAAAQPGPAMALAGEALDEPSKGMKEELGIDLKTDMIPAMSGNTVFGLYPSFGPDAGIDLLIVMDDANGADPAKLARKLEKALEEKIDEDGGGAQEWKVVTHAPDGTEMSRLADEPVDDLRKELSNAEKSFFRPLTLSRGKTIAWASVGNSLVFASSQSLLERAVASRKTPSLANNLAGDAAFGANPSSATDGQVSYTLSMKRLAEGLRNTIDPSHMDVETAKMYRKSLSIYDNVTEPFNLRAKMEPNGRYTGYVSIPFDWTKLPGFFK